MIIPDPILFVHALTTVVLAGLIWTIQVVHYPLFLRIPPDSFVPYESEHMRRITWLVGSLMLIEAASALLLIIREPASMPVWIGAILLGVIWASTGLVQGPLHAKLARDGYDPRRIRFLVRSNWLRTAAWTARAFLVLILLGAEHGRAV
ncbi:MAG: hypothetical protein ACIAQF_13435 [Phycisphaerales bacterium JB065]